jgi:hypothetical protein
METPYTARRTAPQLTRRELLKAGLVAGATFSMRPLGRPPLLWGGETGEPRRGGILRVRGFDPPNFDPHLTVAGFTQSTLSFVYSKLVRHKVGGDVPPGTFILEPDLAERWEELDDTTSVFHLRLLDPKLMKDLDNYWAGIYVGSLGFASNKNFLEKHHLQPPQSWDDLLNPAFIGDRQTFGAHVAHDRVAYALAIRPRHLRSDGPDLGPVHDDRRRLADQGMGGGL